MTDTADQKNRGLLYQLIFGFFPAAAVYVAARLRVPDLLAGGPKSSEELAEATGTHAPSLYRLLRALAYLGILGETESGGFELTGVRKTGCAPRAWAACAITPYDALNASRPTWRSQVGSLSLMPNWMNR